MSKQLNVDLRFNADVSAAKAQLQQLQTQLNSLITQSNQAAPLGLNKSIIEATGKAAELKLALEGAMNVSTGKLDLSKLNESFLKNKTSITEYAQHLSALGPLGQQAFSNIASAINSAEVPLKRSSVLLTNFGTVLKNTARWQISSSLLHGFISTAQSAWNYAQNLNESLNNIRIVTGQSVEEMASFAEQANRAAKALGTTTNEYAKASLIYYQQGLDNNAVQERTDLTVKLANVTGQSMETVSNQLTAIWNNYAKGGENLEHFADVMVRLGADTASSSDEIATGLEKFASIGEMVGLSFDHAAAALATITATTRQSADTVGTALKTIFARIQGLKLGETLDDGTDLNKYSEALQTVGISIKEQNGELKDMDAILQEMGNKWTTLSRDQQVALGQTVAGVRQYNQLVSLMENFDFYEKNITRAENADGSLTNQANIYAESWAAASKRVKASAEDIYDSVLNDKFFIKLTDGFGKFLDIIGNTIDGIGGMRGALALLGAVITKVFAKDLAAGFSKMAYNIKTMTKAGRQQIFDDALKMKQDVNKAQREMYNNGTVSGATRADVNVETSKLNDKIALTKKRILDTGKELSIEEQNLLSTLTRQTEVLGEQAIKAAELREASERTASQIERQLKATMSNASGGRQSTQVADLSTSISQGKELQTQFTIGTSLLTKFQNALAQTGNKAQGLSEIKKYFKEFIIEAEKAGVELGELHGVFQKLKGIDMPDEFINAFESEIIDLGAKAEQVFTDIIVNAEQMEQAGDMNPAQLESFIQNLNRLQQEFSETGQYTEQQISALRDFGLSVDEAGRKVDGLSGKIPTMSESFVAFGQVFSTMAMAISSLKGLFDTWNNENMTFGEKLIATFTTLGLVLTMTTSAFNQHNLVLLSTMSSAIASILPIQTLSAEEIIAGLSAEAGAAGTATFGAALWAVLWPIGLVIAALSVLALGIYGVVKWFKAAGQAAKDKAAALNEDLNKTKELKEETANLTDEVENLSNEFTEQKAAGEDTTVVYAKLVKKLDEVRANYEKLNITSTTLDLLKQAETLGLVTGDWREYNEIIKQANKEAEQAIQKKAFDSVEGDLGGARAAFSEGDGDQYGNRIFGAAGTNDEVANILSEYQDIIKYLNGDDGTLSIEFDDPGEFLKDYDRLQELVTALNAAGYSTHDSTRELNTELAAMADYAERIRNNLPDATIHALSEGLKSATVAPEDIASFEQYSGLVDELTQKVSRYYDTTQEAQEAVSRFLGAYDNLSGMEQSLDFLDRYERKLREMKTPEEAPGMPTFNFDTSSFEPTTQIVMTPTYSKEDIQSKVEEAKTYIETLTAEQRFALGTLDLSEVDITNIEELKSKISENLVEGVRVKAKADISIEAAEFELDAETIQGVADAFIDLAKAGEKSYGILDENAEAAKDAAIRYGRLQKAVLDLSSSYDEYKNILTDLRAAQDKAAKQLVIGQEGYKKLQRSMADLLGTSEKYMDSNFLEAINPSDFDAAARGSETAIERIRQAFIKAQVEAANLDGVTLSGLQQELAKFADGAVIDIDNTPLLMKLIEAQLAAGASAADIEALLSGFSIDAQVSEVFYDELENAKAAAAECADSVVANTSFETEIIPAEAEATETAQEQEFEEKVVGVPISSKGDKVLQTSNTGFPSTVDISQQVTQFSKTVVGTPKTFTNTKTTTGFSMNTKTGDGKKSGGVAGVKIQNAHKTPVGATKVAPSTQRQAASNLGGGGGGKSSSPKNGGGKGSTKTFKPTEKKEVKDEIERYHEINTVLDDLSEQLQDIEVLKEEAWGNDKIGYIDDEIGKVKQLCEAQEEYIQQIEQDIPKDLSNLVEQVEQIDGIDLKLDQFQNVANYNDIIEASTKLYNQRMEEYDKEREILEAQEDADTTELDEKYEAEEKRHELLKETLQQYEDSIDLSEEAKRTLREYISQIQGLNYEKITLKIELQASIDEVDMSNIDYYIEKMSDSYYKQAEVFTYYGDKMELVNNMFKNSIEDYNGARAQFDANDINQTQYFELLQEIYPRLCDSLNNLLALQEEIGEYYLDTLAEINEELDIQTSKFDHLNSKLEYYQDLSALIYGAKNYSNVDKVIQGQYKVLTDELGVVQESLAMYKEQKTKIKEEIKNAETIEDEEIRKRTIEKLENDLNEIDSLIMEEEQKLMDGILRLGEIAVAELENNLAIAKETMRQSLFGDSDINGMLSQIDRLNAKQSEYLTNTNKLYETNKLIRQAQIEMDKTDNQRAKQQYNNYAKHIEELQKAGELSAFELSLAQADFEILQKKIALEEARDAKNQVRLTRDSEGNYGYVYTANQDNIDKAEQEFADAQNKRYNIALEGAQKYQDQYYQAISDMQSALDEVEEQRAQKLISEEEYKRRVAEITDTYLGIAQTAHDLYYQATGAMLEESATKELDYKLQGVGNMKELQKATLTYTTAAGNAFDTYDKQIELVEKSNEASFENIEDGISDVKDEAGALVEEVKTNLITTMKTQLSKTLEESTKKWIETAQAIKSAREEFEKYSKAIGQEIHVSGSQDYAQDIINEFKKGDEADMNYINRLTEARNKKLNGVDLTDYAALRDKYEEGSAEWTAYNHLRNNKISNWKDTDYTDMYKEYIAGGGKHADQRAKDILAARQQKIDYFAQHPEEGIDVSGIMSNIDLIASTPENSYKNPIVANITESEKAETDQNEEAQTSTVTYDLNNMQSLVEAFWAGEFGIGDRQRYFMLDAGMSEELIKQLLRTVVAEAGLTGLGDYFQPMLDVALEKRMKEAGLDERLEIIKAAEQEFQDNRQPNFHTHVSVNYVNKEGKIYRSIAGSLFNGEFVGNPVIDWRYQNQDYSVLQNSDPNIQNTYGQSYYEGFGNADLIPWLENIIGKDQLYATGFSTGGYTGSWGPEGKMAILHQKELVLNAKDTENFLIATNTLREISSVLDSNILSKQLEMFNLKSVMLQGLASQQLQQEVTIHADFPNVQDHTEIETALDNLINAASQRAYRI